MSKNCAIQWIFSHSDSKKKTGSIQSRYSNYETCFKPSCGRDRVTPPIAAHSLHHTAAFPLLLHYE